ncbi:MAG: hypothetical protein IKE60_02465 [Reyranella sp.]|uniref:hypothetical protein n=1 Tax=Reyranella sp. TaxID=1929291 RepID=UPI0025D0B794|nr:hypothetical protein [Reyranella sp.]MBR2813486.1 hypothetical protein [Reyranella sp.]
MFQIDGAGIVNAKPARTALGIAGWYNQSPGSSPGTVVTGEWMNMLQGEMLSILDAGGIAPNKADDSQLLQAIRRIVAGVVPTGSRIGFTGRNAPSGWILGSGRTIGNALSNATERANPDCKALFFLLHEDYLDSELPIYTSAGAPSVRGVSPQVDWDANKQLKVPDYNDRGGVGRGDMGGAPVNRITVAKSDVDTTKLGAAGGLEARTFPFSGVTGPSGTAGLVPATPAANPYVADHTHNFAGNTDERSIMNPFTVETFIIKL